MTKDSCGVRSVQEEFQRFTNDSSFQHSTPLRCVIFQIDFRDEDNRGRTGMMNYSTKVTQPRRSNRNFKRGCLDWTSTPPSVMLAPELSYIISYITDEQPCGKDNLIPL